MKKVKIFPSLISSNVLNLEKTLNELSPHCDGFHIDIMDNHFVPNLTWGPSFANQIDASTDKPLSVHLMVEKPETIIKQLTLKKGSLISIHIEHKNTAHLITLIKDKGLETSIAVKPQTPLETVYSFLPTIDQIMLMSVEPGFSGQKFLPSSLEKLKTLNAYKINHQLVFDSAMDGGINQDNIHELYNLGCTTFCIASAIFSSSDAVLALQQLYHKALEG